MFLRRLGALSLSTIETVGVFVGIPAAVVLLITILVYAGGSRRDKRYRPGRAYEFTPVWFLSAPEQMAASGDGARAVTGANRLALAKADVEGAPEQWPGAGPAGQEALGGASDRW